MKKPKKSYAGIKAIVRLVLIIALFVLALKYIDMRVMPSAKKVMELHALNKATRTIDSSVRSVINQSGITSGDLYTKSLGNDGKLTSLSANTVLINTLCSDVGETVLDGLLTLQDETVYLPLGIISGFDFLSTKGPEIFEVSLRPLGNCTVDYETSFKSEGINQINYQIWLEVRADISVVNPMIRQNIVIERKIPIVNTYINGEVPDSMLYPLLGK